VLALSASTVFVAAGCNSVLGIDQAKLDLADAGTTGSGSTGETTSTSGTSDGASVGGDGAAPEGGLLQTCIAIRGGAQNDCNDCVATRCCVEYDACIRDGMCSDDLAAYDTCIGTYDVDAGASACTDILSGSSSLFSQALARCVQHSCPDKCGGDKAIGDLCTSFCSCMGIYCPRSAVPGGSGCAAACATWTADQKSCRNYHCSLAADGIHSGAGVGPHCDHSIGLLGVCP
jgi:hypothetical protein